MHDEEEEEDEGDEEEDEEEDVSGMRSDWSRLLEPDGDADMTTSRE